MRASPEEIRGDWRHSNPLRLGIATVAGLIAGGLDYAFGMRGIALLVCGDVGALVYVVWMYLSAMGLDRDETCALATREDPGRVAVDLVVLLACMGAIGAVGKVLLDSGKAQGSEQDILAGVGAASVFCAWLLVHTIFAIRYARLYYKGEPGGVDFHDEKAGCFSDFAYLSFTVGMTFQVSDTEINDGEIRRTIFHHGLLSYLFGTVIVATTINLVAGLAK